MQSVSSRICTRVAVSISYDDNHYIAGASQEKKKKKKQLIALVKNSTSEATQFFFISNSDGIILAKQGRQRSLSFIRTIRTNK